ncbi:hypothetical protein EP7_001696 [Isosphaeraceae bacterium EP7]
MHRHPFREAARIAALILSPVVALALSPESSAQVTLIPAQAQSYAPSLMPAPVPASGGLNGIANRVAEEVRQLGHAIGLDLGRTPNGPALIDDVRELALSLDDFRNVIRGQQDPNQIRQAYAGVDGTWQYLQSSLSAAGVSSPAVDRGMARVGQAQTELRQALGFSPGYGPGAPSSQDEARRLADILAQRTGDLARATRFEMMAAPGGNRLVRDADDLDRAAGQYEVALSTPGFPPELAPTQFRPVADLIDRVGRSLSSTPPTRGVLSAWRSVNQAAELIRQSDPTYQPPVVVNPIPPFRPQPPIRPYPPIDHVVLRPVPAPVEVNALSDQLVGQVSDFLRVFSSNSAQVPERAGFLSDAERLRIAAIKFQRDASTGMTVGDLAFRYRDVDASYRRLARRTDRVAKGRLGPNIAQIGVMGQTCSQIADYLALPGYPAFIPH